MDFFIVFTMLAVTVAADIFTTNAVLDAGGHEMNPFVRFLMRKFGDKWWLPKILFTGFLVLVATALGYGLAFMFAFAIVHAGVAIWNWRTYKRATGM